MKLHFDETNNVEPYRVWAMVSQIGEPHSKTNEMNLWACKSFGERDLGSSSWRFERVIIDHSTQGLVVDVEGNPYYTRRVKYSWIFDNKEDAIAFNSRWSNETRS